MHQESQRLTKVFEHLDANGDDLLTLAEYRREKSYRLGGTTCERTIATLDGNADGQLSVTEFCRLPWHVVGRHAEMKHCPVSVEAWPDSTKTLTSVIAPQLLRLSPPLTGAVRGRESGLAIEALLTIARKRNEKDRQKGIAVGVSGGYFQGGRRIRIGESWKGAIKRLLLPR